MSEVQGQLGSGDWRIKNKKEFFEINEHVMKFCRRKLNIKKEFYYLFDVIVWVKVVFRKTVFGDWRFDYLSGSRLQSQVKNRRQMMMIFMPLVLVWIGESKTRGINTIIWRRRLFATLKTTTSTQVVETSVTNNSLSEDYPHPDDHAKQITDTPGFKPFTMSGI